MENYFVAMDGKGNGLSIGDKIQNDISKNIGILEEVDGVGNLVLRLKNTKEIRISAYALRKSKWIRKS